MQEESSSDDHPSISSITNPKVILTPALFGDWAEWDLACRHVRSFDDHMLRQANPVNVAIASRLKATILIQHDSEIEDRAKQLAGKTADLSHMRRARKMLNRALNLGWVPSPGQPEF